MPVDVALQPMPDDPLDAVRAVPPRVWLAIAVFLTGVVLSVGIGRLGRRLLERLGVPEIIEGTAFERAAREFGTSTVAIASALTTYFLVVVTVFAASSVAGIDYANRFWNTVAGFLPQLFVATLVVMVGLVIGDKIELVVADQLKGVKIPEATVVPTLVKYSVFYVAVLVALSQLNVATLALVVLLAAYVFALVTFGAVASHALLTSAAAGVYLLRHEPYGIGDEVRIGEASGIVQEVNLYVTHVEADGEEYVVPNAKVFRDGIVRVRD